jgi:hypothetical protein
VGGLGGRGTGGMVSVERCGVPQIGGKDEDSVGLGWVGIV